MRIVILVLVELIRIGSGGGHHYRGLWKRNGVEGSASRLIEWSVKIYLGIVFGGLQLCSDG